MNALNLSGKNFEELLSLFFCEIADDDYYDVVACQLIKDYAEPVQGLIWHLSKKRLRAIIFGLGCSGDKKWRDVVLKFVDLEEGLVAAEALDALRNLDFFSYDLVLTHLHHASPYVRSSALRFAKKGLANQALAFLVDGLSDDDAIVRQSALDELEGVATIHELHRVIPLLTDPDSGVRDAARWLIDRINDPPLSGE